MFQQQRPSDLIPKGFVSGAKKVALLIIDLSVPVSPLLPVPAPSYLPLPHSPCSREKAGVLLALDSVEQCEGVSSHLQIQVSQTMDPSFYAVSVP